MLGYNEKIMSAIQQIIMMLPAVNLEVQNNYNQHCSLKTVNKLKTVFDPYNFSLLFCSQVSQAFI